MRSHWTLLTLTNLFEASGKTRLLEDVAAGSDTILVDSTVGFSKSGNVHIKPKDSNDYINVSYTDKTVNQFLGCLELVQSWK